MRAGGGVELSDPPPDSNVGKRRSQAGPTVTPLTVRTCVNLTTGGIRVIKTLPTDLQWAGGKNPRACAKEDEQGTNGAEP